MSKRVKSYQGMIGKTIKQIEDHSDCIKITFEDETHCYIDAYRDCILSAFDSDVERGVELGGVIYKAEKK